MANAAKANNVVQLEAKPNPEPYLPANGRERRSLDEQKKRRAKTKPSAKLSITQMEGKSEVRVRHNDDATGFTLLMESLGTTSPDFAHGVLSQVVNISARGQTPDEDASNFALAVVGGIEPRDQVEAMLAAQMAAVHMATMSMARRLNQATLLPQQDGAERAFNKLARTFAAQVEALKRYRSKGEQRVIVERVTVEKGGQAIVGAINTKGGVGDESER